MANMLQGAVSIGVMAFLGTIFAFAFSELLNPSVDTSGWPAIVVTSWDLLPWLLPFGVFIFIVVAMWDF